jgi:uncharacterized protein (TIGR03437 family)
MLWFVVAAGTVGGARELAAFPADTGSPATASVSLTEVVADSQGSARVEVALASGGQTLSAIQFDISYQTQAMVLSVAPGITLPGAGKGLWAASPQPGLERVLIVGMNQNALSDGVLATLSVEMIGGASPGVYPLGLTNALASDPRGEAVPISASGGGVVVPGTGVAAPATALVSNAASYTAGSVAPGEIVVIGGNSFAGSTPISAQIPAAGVLATSLGSTTVLFDDIPAPLLYTTVNQLSAIVPYEVSGQTQTSIQVEYQGVRSAPLTIAVAPTAPGIFTMNASGTGQGAIVNQNGTINGPGNPAARGDVVSIYGTGEGQTVPPGMDGIIVTAAELRQPLQKVTVSIGGQSADVLYAGSAGDEVAGLLQVNARIPLGIAPGAATPVTIYIGGSSQAGVTMAVQ